MKKTISIFIILFVVFSSFAAAQRLVPTSVEKKNVVLEEYTGIHCGWCPEGHKLAKALHDKYPGQVVLLNIHQGSFAAPGSGEPDYRTEWGNALANQAKVSGYPAGTVNRREFSGLTAEGELSLNRGQWEAAAKIVFPEDSPVNVGAESTFDPETRKLTINIELYVTGELSNDALNLNIAVLENNVVGPQSGAPIPTNYAHMHMLRDFITGQWGETFSDLQQGSFVEKTYEYTLQEEWNADNCDIAVYAVENTKNIYTGVNIKADGGTTLYIGKVDISGTRNLYQSVPELTNFDLLFESKIEGNSFTLSLVSDQPEGWSANLLTANESGQEVNINVSQNMAAEFGLTVDPGDVPGLGKYYVIVKSIDNPEAPTRISSKILMLSGVKDVVINNDVGWGDNSDNDASYYQDDYLNGLEANSNPAFCSMMLGDYTDIVNAEIDANIENIYYNVGWTFPSLTEQTVDNFKKFLDRGGNIFLSGQDFAWDNFDLERGNGTLVTQQFMKDYLRLDFVDDGSTANSSISFIDGETLMGSLSSSMLENKYGTDNSGNPYMYPDVITPLGSARPLFYYNNDDSKVGGIRLQNDVYKIVYFGISLEMIQDEDVRSWVIRRTDDWFHGKITGVEYEKEIAQLFSYPNPAKENVMIDFNGLDVGNVVIQDMTGKSVNTRYALSDSGINISTTGLSSGVYYAAIYSGAKLIKSIPFVVSK